MLNRKKMETEEKVRCFIAIHFPKKVIEEIEKVQGDLKKKDLFVGKFTKGRNLHLTLKFLGEIEEGQVEEVKKKLREIKINKFKVELGKVGVFSEKFIRIIWIEILGKEIFELQKKIDESLKEMFELEVRFMSHLTIARVKNVKDKKLFFKKLKEIKVPEVNFDINEFYLMKSELKSEGPIYEVIEKYSLESN
jgi:2'-5' RNA ligase